MPRMVFFLARGVHYWSHERSAGERGHVIHVMLQTGPPLGLDGTFVHWFVDLLQPHHSVSIGDVQCSIYNHIFLRGGSSLSRLVSQYFKSFHERSRPSCVDSFPHRISGGV